MSKKPETKRAIAEASVTLPEGAVVTVSKYDKRTEVHATRGEQELRMSVDNISAQAVGYYLTLLVKEIGRQRALLTSRPAFVPKTKRPLDDFVKNMAMADMFIFDALVSETPGGVVTAHTDGSFTAKLEKPKKNEHTQSSIQPVKKPKKTQSKIDLEAIKSIFPDATIIPETKNRKHK